MDYEAIWQQAGNLIVKYAVDLSGAILILIAGGIVVAWVRRAALRAFKRSRRIDDTLAPFLATAIRYGLLIFVVIMALAQFGVQTASIIATLGAAGLAIGLALQGTLSNIAAGLMLLVLRPFNVGDYISAGSVDGTVQSIGLFATELKTADGVFLFAPNSEIWNKAIKNFDHNPTRRMEVIVGIDYDADPELAIRVIAELVSSDPRLLEDPLPLVAVKELADSSVNIVIRAWAQRSDYWAALWDLQKNVKRVLDEAEIGIPFPQRDIHIIPSPEEEKATA